MKTHYQMFNNIFISTRHMLFYSIGLQSIGAARKFRMWCQYYCAMLPRTEGILKEKKNQRNCSSVSLFHSRVAWRRAGIGLIYILFTAYFIEVNFHIWDIVSVSCNLELALVLCLILYSWGWYRGKNWAIFRGKWKKFLMIEKNN